MNQTLYVVSVQGINVIMFKKKHKRKNDVYIHARATQRCISLRELQYLEMLFLDIYDPAKRTALVEEVCKSDENCPAA